MRGFWRVFCLLVGIMFLAGAINDGDVWWLIFPGGAAIGVYDALAHDA